MKAPATLGLYGVGLAAVFAASFAVGSAVIPAQLSEGWISQIEQDAHPAVDHEGADQ
ncbi:MAG: hypothetical protein ACOH19_15365 [Rhodoglobus sp.]